MNVYQMREALRQYYGSGSPFAEKLKTMSDGQVIAIYFRLKNKGVIK
jgi:hypothetical protein